MSNHLQVPLVTSSKLALTKEEQVADEKTLSLQAESIVNTVAFPMVLKAVLELGVIDIIAATGNDAWLSPSEITVSLPTKPMNPETPALLDRMLRLLVSHSILKCRMVESSENGRTGKMERVYAAEPVCKYFLKYSDGSGSLASLFTLFHDQVIFKTWTNLKDVILEGKDAFSSAEGMRLFEYINVDERFGELFHRAMSESSTMVMKKVLEVYRGFEGVNTLVDVGGGTGTILGLITSKYPHIKGVNFDLPQILTKAPFYPGIKHISGDMFIEVPKGDAVFMKWILHDWTDEHCIKILKNCWKSLPEKGKVIIVERITPIEPKCGDFFSDIVFAMDLLMLTQCSGGKERSLSQFENLALKSDIIRICKFLTFPMVFKAALELGVIETIASVEDGMWLSPSEIAFRLPTKPTNPEAPMLLDRMMRLLASHSILKCRVVETGENDQTGKTERVYAAEPVCKFFLKDSDASGSLLSLFTLCQNHVVFKALSHLKDVVLEGRDAFTSAHGMRVFQYMGSDEQFAEMFNPAMSESSTMVMKKVLETYKGFENVNTLVDVGGGVGTVLGLVTSKYPHIKGINFDLASVLVDAPPYPGVQHVAGDMLVEIPKGDAIFMKWMLRAWNDEICVKILKNCWTSLPEKGKVIIVELVMPIEPKRDECSSNIELTVDMFILSQSSGCRERSLSQFEALAYASGFLRCEIVSRSYSFALIEFHK